MVTWLDGMDLTRFQGEVYLRLSRSRIDPHPVPLQGGRVLLDLDGPWLTGIRWPDEAHAPDVVRPTVTYDESTGAGAVWLTEGGAAAAATSEPVTLSGHGGLGVVVVHFGHDGSLVGVELPYGAKQMPPALRAALERHRHPGDEDHDAQREPARHEPSLAERRRQALVEWAGAHRRLSNNISAGTVALSVGAVLALAGEPIGLVLLGVTAMFVTVLAIVEIASRVTGRPIVLLPVGRDGHAGEP